MTDVKQLWDDCERLSMEEVSVLTGCTMRDLSIDTSTTEQYGGIDSQDRVFVFLQWPRPPRFIFGVYMWVDNRFVSIRSIEAMCPVRMNLTIE